VSTPQGSRQQTDHSARCQNRYTHEKPAISLIQADRNTRFLAIAAAVVAGFVDAVGFIETKGYFVSFMTGNSTRLGIGLAGLGDVMLPAALVLAFVGGVTLGSLLIQAVSFKQSAVTFAFVAVLLAISAALARLGLAAAATLLMAGAMGAMNAAFQANGEVRIGLTYMTGTLVKIGQRAAGAIRGGPPWLWLPYLLQWLGLMSGVALGAATYGNLGAQALWLPAAAMVALSLLASR
jgi:uncharacterized membrane protein YoaK (UPF0700 family)